MKRIAILALALIASPSAAQSTYPTPLGGRVAGVVPLQCDASGLNCTYAGDPAAPAAGAQQVQGNSASGATDAGNPVKIGGKSNGSTPAAVASGQRVDAWFGNVGQQIFGAGSGAALGGTYNAVNLITEQTSVPRPLAVGTYVYDGTNLVGARGDATGAYAVSVASAVAAAGTTTSVSAAVSAGIVAKATAGNLYGFNVVSGASAGYALVFNSATVPADGAVTPVRCLPLAANTGVDVNLRAQPSYYSAGVSIAFSTTGCFTKTASATAFIAADVK